MTRMWMVEPSLLCDEHLQREHWEIHQLADVLHGDWDVEPYTAVMKVIGHAARGQVFPRYMCERHDRLAVHMDERGIGHDSAISGGVAVRFSGSVTAALTEHNREELARRCSKCRDRIEGVSTHL